MGNEAAYGDWLKQDFGELIDSLELNDTQKHVLKSRWVDQVIWMESKARHSRTRHYALRLTAIVGGVIVPALVGINLQGPTGEALRWVILGISLIVAITSATEEFFHYSERWRHYRGTVELLKSEGWNFFQLSGPYSRRDSHAQAYETFATRVEEILQQDVQAYISQIVGQKREARAAETEAGGKAIV